MTNILIVDDLPMVVKAVKSLVDWESNGFLVVGEAFNGKEALDVLNTRQVDILITDLKMPVMDGMELIKHVQNMENKPKIIVMSAYDEFGLVRESFKLGASDYILKFEMDADKLLEICRKLEIQINTEKKQKRMIEEQRLFYERLMQAQKKLEQQIYFNKSVIKDRFFRDIIWCRYTNSEDVRRKAEDLELKHIDGKMIFMIICIDNIGTILEGPWKKDNELLSFAIGNIVEEIVQQQYYGNTFCISMEEYGIIFSLQQAVGRTELKNKLLSLFMNIGKCLWEHLGIHISGGLSRIEEGIFALPAMYSQARTACQYRFISGKGKLITYDEIPVIYVNNNLKKAERVEYLRQVLQTMDKEKIIMSLSFLKIEENEVCNTDIESVREIFEKYTWVLIEFMQKQGIIDNFESLIRHFYSYLLKQGSLKELNEWLSNVIRLLSEMLSPINPVVSLAREYIHSHYSEDLTLALIAEKIGISSGHLSRLFREEVGMSVLDYLNAYRIEKAKEYLKGSYLKIYEICEKVGYKNPEHFSRLFKKLVGKSPKEYGRTV